MVSIYYCSKGDSNSFILHQSHDSPAQLEINTLSPIEALQGRSVLHGSGCMCHGENSLAPTTTTHTSFGRIPFTILIVSWFGDIILIMYSISLVSMPVSVESDQL